MKKIVLACDLDNTLIYSYKHRVDGDICVELLDGREQSFITARTRELLPQVMAALRFLPVTTRSVEQYLRIQWRQTCPEWSVVTNGGLLLHNGQADMDWCAYSQGLVADYRKIWPDLAAKLGENPGYARYRMVDDVYMYTVCADVEAAERCRIDFDNFGGLQVVRGGRKVYFLPPGINKGLAVERLRQIFPDEIIVAAGDSQLDLPMLMAADAALLPNAELAAQADCSYKYICPPGEHFAEFVLATVLCLVGK